MAGMQTGRGAVRIRDGVEVAGLSDLGCQRANNEDCYSYWEPASEELFEGKGRLAIVADGMGGHEGGQEASRIAVETIQEIYSGAAAGDPQSILVAGFREAHQRIRSYAAHQPHLQGMGTTATSVVLMANRLYYAHVGDSRLYLIRGQEASRLTHDHSYVSRLLQNGVITAAEAEAHPQRHILTAALGTGPEVLPELPEHPLSLNTGDVLVLCTDGLWGLLSDQELQQVVTGRKLSDACEALIEMAKQRGGPDNITVQLIRLT